MAVRKFPDQPIRDHVWRSGLTLGEFAEKFGPDMYGHVRLAMTGKVPPNEELRRRAPEMLGVPLEQLFTAESLAATCRPLSRGLRRKYARQ